MAGAFPTLIVATGPGAGQRIELTREMTVGREGADVLIADPEMSRCHMKVRPIAGGIEVEDLDSRNGTHVTGTRISHPVLIGAGDTIRVGQTTITVELPETGADRTRLRPIIALDDRTRISDRPVVSGQPAPADAGAPAAAGPPAAAQPAAAAQPPTLQKTTIAPRPDPIGGPPDLPPGAPAGGIPPGALPPGAPAGGVPPGGPPPGVKLPAPVRFLMHLGPPGRALAKRAMKRRMG